MNHRLISQTPSSPQGFKPLMLTIEVRCKIHADVDVICDNQTETRLASAKKTPSFTSLSPFAHLFESITLKASTSPRPEPTDGWFLRAHAPLKLWFSNWSNRVKPTGCFNQQNGRSLFHTVGREVYKIHNVQLQIGVGMEKVGAIPRSGDGWWPVSVSLMV